MYSWVAVTFEQLVRVFSPDFSTQTYIIITRFSKNTKTAIKIITCTRDTIPQRKPIIFKNINKPKRFLCTRNSARLYNFFCQLNHKIRRQPCIQVFWKLNPLSVSHTNRKMVSTNRTECRHHDSWVGSKKKKIGLEFQLEQNQTGLCVFK